MMRHKYPEQVPIFCQHSLMTAVKWMLLSLQMIMLPWRSDLQGWLCNQRACQVYSCDVMTLSMFSNRKVEAISTSPHRFPLCHPLNSRLSLQRSQRKLPVLLLQCSSWPGPSATQPVTRNPTRRSNRLQNWNHE